MAAEMTEGRGRGGEPTEGADQIIREAKTGEVVRRRRRRKEKPWSDMSEVRSQ